MACLIKETEDCQNVQKQIIMKAPQVRSFILYKPVA